MSTVGDGEPQCAWRARPILWCVRSPTKRHHPISCSSQATDGQTAETQQPPATGIHAFCHIVATESGGYNFDILELNFGKKVASVIDMGHPPLRQLLGNRDGHDATQTLICDTQQKLKQISPSSSPPSSSYCLDQAELMGGGRQTNSRACGR